MASKLFLTGLPLAHISLTAASLGLGLFGRRPPLFSPGGVNNESFDARHYDLVTEMVTKMYSGRGAYHRRCQLADSVTFEDPAAICKSPDEVRETFRVLKGLKPKSLSSPKCINVEPRGSSIALTYALHQRYGLLSVDLCSHLVVEVQLIQMRDLPESEFLITRFEERWNGIPPQNNMLLWVTRRINGILSWHLTRRLVPDN
jgi:hypothetical protein